ncbi:MAG TPA: low affinity iron permease family protein [Edaphocola sp.]|nr:low affinity iron permease family protein [Edaphocola sp.]
MSAKKQIVNTKTIAEKETKASGFKGFFDRFSNKAALWTGSPYAFIIALVAVISWAVSGPVFKYSDTWQLVINTSTTIITFLMVFLIQQAQNKDTIALHLKLDELISANKFASNRLVDVEELNEEELKKLKDFYVSLRGNIKSEKEIHESHSIDQAEGTIKVTQDVKMEENISKSQKNKKKK